MIDHTLSVATTCIKRSPVMCSLMVVGLGLGIGVYVTAHGSHRAYTEADVGALAGVVHLEIDRGYQPAPPLDHPRMYGYSNRPNLLLSWRDAQAMAAHPDVALLFTAHSTARSGGHGEDAMVRYASPGLLPMFGVEVTGAAPIEDGDGVWVERAFLSGWRGPPLVVGGTLHVAGVPRTIRGVVEIPRAHPPLFELPWFSQPGVVVPISAFSALRTPPSDRLVWGHDSPTFEALLASDDPFVHAWAHPRTPAATAALEAALVARAGPARRAVLCPVERWHQLVSVPHPAFALFEVFSVVALIAAVFGLSRLLLAQFAARGPEVGLRRALGARPARIFFEHLTEALMIGAAGGLLGLALGAIGLALMGRVLPFDNLDFALSWRHALEGVAIGLLAAALAALVPAWRAAAVSPARAMGKS